MSHRSLLSILAVTAVALAAAAPARGDGPADYVRGAQNAHGGYGMTRSGASTQFATGWALLGLPPPGAPLSRSSGTVRGAARWLERRQNGDDGFNVGGRGTSGIDDTGYTVQALVAAGRRGTARDGARRPRSSPARRGARAVSRWSAAAPRTPGRRPTRSRASCRREAPRPRCGAARPTCAR
jgi:hypothetical protein